jgi:hypothetical protein
MCSRHVKLPTSDNLEPPMHLDFRLLCYCTAKSIAFHSLACISDWEIMYLDPYSLTIMHRERANKVFRKRSSWLLNSLHQALHHDLSSSLSITCRALSHLPQTPLVCFWIMFYILNMFIYVHMILLDNLLQCFLFIAVIDLSTTCESTIVLICNSLVMFMSYFWIKIKLKLLIFPTYNTSERIRNNQS